MRFKVAEQEDLSKGYRIQRTIAERRAEVDRRLTELGATLVEDRGGDGLCLSLPASLSTATLKRLADYVEDVEGTEILSLGSALELVMDLGDAGRVADQYGLRGFRGTHAIGHTRMATESDVDIRSAHPYWAYPYRDIWRGP